MGTISERQVGKRADGSSIANLDAGLIELDDVTRWTAQVFGIGEIGETADISADSFSQDLIGCPVRAFGAASGVLEGEIHGLLYRYRSMAGHDYIADLLIGPRSPDQQLATRTGDSGTLWFYDPPRRPKPGPGTDDEPPLGQGRSAGARPACAPPAADRDAVGRAACGGRRRRELHPGRDGHALEHDRGEGVVAGGGGDGFGVEVGMAEMVGRLT